MKKLFYSVLIFNVCVLFAQESIRIGSDNDFLNNMLKSKVQENVESSSLKKKALSGQGELNASVDEKEYIVDSGDEFVIKLNVKGPSHKVYYTVVTPDGNIIIPGGPTIYVRYVILKEARGKIINVLSKSFPNVKIEAYLNMIHNVNVDVVGSVPQPGRIMLSSGDRVFNAVLNMYQDLKNTEINAYINKISSLRNIKIIRRNEEKNADLVRYMYTGDLTQNPYVMDQDIIYVPYRDSTHNSISVNGAVAQETNFEFKKGDKLLDALIFSGGLLTSADSQFITLTRFYNNKSDFERLFLKIPSDSGYALKADDRIFVRKKYGYHGKSEIVINGAVMYPGKYAIINNATTILEIIERSGGIISNAYLKNAVILRKKKAIDENDLQRLKKMYVQDMTDLEKSYYRTKSRENSQIVACNFEKLILENDLSENIVLRGGDSILIPESTKLVQVSGGVYLPGSVRYNKNLNYLDYIKIAGGFNDKAREGDTQIIRVSSGVWLEADEDIPINEGDVIYVPEKEKITWFEAIKDGLTVTAQLATIIYLIFVAQK
ncbi:MAG: SLBB domain-containing protein [Calditrichaceae bacterium]|nr:SLBB domain-containing protein [Calditrichaceae bacterium]MBN2707669.1 SLBB domain-containing protein [Calditrichaceae bacterium]RQV94849.1 MAG: hypothetical protein EH224_09260 [Calditrichota bacterium]